MRSSAPPSRWGAPAGRGTQRAQTPLRGKHGNVGEQERTRLVRCSLALPGMAFCVLPRVTQFTSALLVARAVPASAIWVKCANRCGPHRLLHVPQGFHVPYLRNPCRPRRCARGAGSRAAAGCARRRRSRAALRRCRTTACSAVRRYAPATCRTARHLVSGHVGGNTSMWSGPGGLQLPGGAHASAATAITEHTCAMQLLYQ